MNTHARPLAALLLLVSFCGSAWAQTAPLNDSGQTQCNNGSTLVACDAGNAGNGATYPSQDGRYGRDAAQAKSLLPAKTGGGAAGFDFTALDASGAVTTTPGSHACVKDNVTGLIWSTETLTQTWTQANTAYPNPAGSAADVYTRCGYNAGWRLPTRRELLSIVNYGELSACNSGQCAIDGTYFPGTEPSWYWTADVYAPNSAGAWGVVFYDGDTNFDGQGYSYYVRLVRSGQ